MRTRQSFKGKTPVYTGKTSGCLQRAVYSAHAHTHAMHSYGTWIIVRKEPTVGFPMSVFLSQTYKSEPISPALRNDVAAIRNCFASEERSGPFIRGVQLLKRVLFRRGNSHSYVQYLLSRRERMWPVGTQSAERRSVVQGESQTDEVSPARQTPLSTVNGKATLSQDLDLDSVHLYYKKVFCGLVNYLKHETRNGAHLCTRHCGRK